MIDRHQASCIYVLEDPETGAVRYVGRSIDPESRYKAHMGNKANTHSRKDLWLANLKAHGKEPKLVIVEVGIKWKDAADVEQKWIDFFGQEGADLLNGSRGVLGAPPKYDGCGFVYFKNTPSVQKKMERIGDIIGSNLHSDIVEYALDRAIDDA